MSPNTVYFGQTRQTHLLASSNNHPAYPSGTEGQFVDQTGVAPVVKQAVQTVNRPQTAHVFLTFS